MQELHHLSQDIVPVDIEDSQSGSVLPADPASLAAVHADARSPSLKSRAIRGTAISLFGQVAGLVIRLGGNLILTRLLYPKAFGLMGIISLLNMGLDMTTDLGIRACVIQHKRGDDPVFLNTAWTIQAIRGVLLWLIGSAIALPVASFYGYPELKGLVLVAALNGITFGLASTKLFTLDRKLALGRLVFIELFTQLSGLTVMVALAYRYHSVWALLLGTMMTFVTRLALSHALLPGKGNRFQWDPSAAREILLFGRWIIVSSAITFLAMRLDTVLISKLIPVDVFGVYNIGGQLAGMPALISVPVVASVVLPALSEAFRSDKALLAASFAKAREMMLAIGSFVCLGVALLAPSFFHLLYDDRYEAAGWIVQLCCVGIWFHILHEAWTHALLAIGDSRALATTNTLKLIVTTSGCLAGYAVAELPGLILGSALGSFAGYALTVFYLEKNDLRGVFMDARFTLLGLFLGVAGIQIPQVLAGKLYEERYTSLASGILGVAILIPLGASTLHRVLKAIRAR